MMLLWPDQQKANIGSKINDHHELCLEFTKENVRGMVMLIVLKQSEFTKNINKIWEITCLIGCCTGLRNKAARLLRSITGKRKNRSK